MIFSRGEELELEAETLYAPSVGHNQSPYTEIGGGVSSFVDALRSACNGHDHELVDAIETCTVGHYTGKSSELEGLKTGMACV